MKYRPTQCAPRAKPGRFMVDRMGLQQGNRRYIVVKSLESARSLARKYSSDNATIWKPLLSGWEPA